MGLGILVVVLFVLYLWLDGRRFSRFAALPLLLLLASTASGQQVYNVLPSVNSHRASVGLNQLIERRDLQLAAERTARRFAAEGWTAGGHKGERLKDTAEGVGARSGRDVAGRRFYACYHVYHKAGTPGPSRSHVYGGAAAVVVGNQTFYALELDSDRHAGGRVGSEGNSGSRRVVRRRFRR